MTCYQNGFQLLANASSKGLTLMPAILDYSAIFPPSMMDGGEMAETKTALPLPLWYGFLNCVTVNLNKRK